MFEIWLLCSVLKLQSLHQLCALVSPPLVAARLFKPSRATQAGTTACCIAQIRTLTKPELSEPWSRCTPPRPQGPIEIAKGSGSISFTNVLPKQATFSFAMDNPAFLVKASETIAAKKSCQVSISTSKDAAGQAAIGRLTISCPAETTAVWTYYLRSTA